MSAKVSPTRCAWPKSDLDISYHDKEWGVPLHDDRRLFEAIILDSFQAGLSWSTILNKRENFRKAFDGFDPRKVARYDAKTRASLMRDAGIVRNRMKIDAAVKNAKAFLAIQKEFGSFDAYFWRFVKGKPIINHWKSLKELPARTALSDRISKDLKERGFSFVGSTIIYAMMQATGMVNDHMMSCFRHKEVQANKQ